MWLIYVFLFTLSECFSQSPHTQEMCESEKVNDCSFQIPDAHEGSCLIYNTLACKNFDFSNWSRAVVTKVSSEFDAPFVVSVTPYAAVLHELQKGIPVSAINMTFTILDKDIDGFIISIIEDSLPKNICRVFDFRNAAATKSVPLTLFYDCLYNLVERGIQNVHIEFRALPINMELSYYVYIPAVQKSASVCDWQPLIMIFSGSLSKHVVQARFTRAPSYLNVSSYIVKLVSSHSKIMEKVLNMPEDFGSDLMAIEFPDLDEGYYSLAVNAVGCADVETNPFYVGSGNIGKLVIIYICAVILLISVVTVFFLIWWRLYRHHMSFFLPDFKPVILFVYSRDCDDHEEFVQAYKNYLTAHCNVRVVTIYGSTPTNPQIWLKDKYLESDIIMFIISEGMFHFFDRKNIPPMKGHHWHNQLSDAEAFISEYRFKSIDDMPKKRKYCKVCFPYSSRDHIPKCLGKEMGQCFILPDEMDKLLSFIFDYSPKISCSNIYPKPPGHNIKSFEKGKELIKEINIMKNAVATGTHIQYKNIKKTGNTTINEHIKDLSLGNENASEKYEEYEPGNIFQSNIFTQAAEELCYDKEYEHLLNQVPKDDTGSPDEYSLRDIFRRDLQQQTA